MMRAFRFLLVIFIAASACTAQTRTVLYASDAFTLAPDSVTEGKYVAKALSRTEINSTYQSEYRRRTERTITFKFALNGADNERAPGQDHHLTVTGDNGSFVSPVFEFGAADPAGASRSVKDGERYLTRDTDVLFRADMRRVLADMRTKGAFVTITGERITPENFKGVWIAGATFPLSWNFTALPSQSAFAMSDPDSDGIYTATIHFKKEIYPGRFADSVRTWTLSHDISMYPESESPQLLADALYNMSLEELNMDVRSDGAFMAGEMWPGVWTRDVSYSILLSLAAIAPDASKTTLMAKVKEGRIIQDTGTGGSWPVSSDRMVWSLAAWEVYVVTGDRDWLKKAYEIIKASAADDLETVRDGETGLFRGESSFLDWREQTYPQWMDPKDIYMSENLGTNAVHCRTYRILARMASVLGEDGKKYSDIADAVGQGMNTYLWMAEKGYYAQYRYGRINAMTSPRSEALGEALSVLFDIADTQKKSEIISKTPVTPYGIPCIAPQIPNIPPYHNDAVWAFVESFWGWASAKANNAASVSRALASVWRAAALYLTNKENLVATTGDFMGTEINSNRQLWSVAGNLALTYRILYGMTFTPDALELHPFIPEAYAGDRMLGYFRYRNAMLNISVHGWGNRAAAVTLDGITIDAAVIPATLTGLHTVDIVMNDSLAASDPVNETPVRFTPAAPSVTLERSRLMWRRVPQASSYRIYSNGQAVGETIDTVSSMTLTQEAHEMQIEAVDAAGLRSFASEPVMACLPANVTHVSVSRDTAAFIRLTQDSSTSVTYRFTARAAGPYAIDIRYANGSGPINTDNKCAIRTLLVDGAKAGTVVLPQRGEGMWDDWGYTNALTVQLARGTHTVTLEYRPSDANMNRAVNTALVKEFRFTLLR